MITILKKNTDKSFDIISDSEVMLNEQFVIGFNTQTKEQIYQTVNTIHEQRKGRGTYADESLRPFWAKVS